MFQDPDPFLSVLGSGSLSYLTSITKINWEGKLTKYAFLLGPPGYTDKENQFKMYKKYCFRDPFPMKQMYPYQIEIPDPDPYQSEKHDPDQNGLDPQH
jgi:hypothetical protein